MERENISEPRVRPSLHAAADPPRAAIERLALVVEDEWLVRLELVDALESADWTVTETNSAEEALALLRKGERFHLIVTDIRLSGGLTGWDIAEAFRLAHPGGGVIYASGNAALVDRLVPGSIFMSKPIRMDELLSVCDRMWKSGAEESGSS